MKTYFDKKEKELIIELKNKLNNKVINIDNVKSDVAGFIGDNKLKIYRNRTRDMRYDYILVSKGIELGIAIKQINKFQYVVIDTYWNGF
ncbi:hypothetical protein [Clostridium estertheticum]|uniref:Uncharacterized protein n=1 Tax=Clostridium estertheticum TaxID=238834 RepID=A0A7Y3SZC5_9CLOT|nr:hypothetical protein [Clostridium estertheticum]NNU78156.1 hypothetical protein [Clostridium estertheticum]WBL47732.1 hypothetical protein LOR37_03315 [Clostridium estertheticum]